MQVRFCRTEAPSIPKLFNAKRASNGIPAGFRSLTRSGAWGESPVPGASIPNPACLTRKALAQLRLAAVDFVNVVYRPGTGSFGHRTVGLHDRGTSPMPWVLMQPVICHMHTQLYPLPGIVEPPSEQEDPDFLMARRDLRLKRYA